MKNLITETRKNELIYKSKKAKNYSGSSGNRWTEKNKCKVATQVKDYNKIDMNSFWKDDVLKFNITVQGETNIYIVTIEFSNILKRIQDKIKQDKNKLQIKCIYEALFQALNSSDVKVACSCPDFKYRFQVWATKNNYNAGKAENREAKITNPNDDLGSACKHILCVLNNVSWLQKIAAVINNYIYFARDNMEYNYGKFIFPKLFGIPYEKAIQMTMDSYDNNGKIKQDLASTEEIINLSNAIGKGRGKFKKGSNKNTAPKRAQ